MKKVLIVFGTRPEAIKMAPLVKAFEKSIYNSKVCITAQHREMLDQVLDFFNIQPDYDLDLMKPGQDLFDITARILVEIKAVLQEFQPDYVFVHGDTTTSMAASLAGFYYGAKICHVEAGLRTYDKLAPFPEEINRQLTGRIADLHFAPTKKAEANLLKEGVNSQNIVVTGNTVIDALFQAVEKIKKDSYFNRDIKRIQRLIDKDKKIILVTGHRRENFGNGFLNICTSLKAIAEANNVQIVYPVHLNPNVQKPVFDLLDDIKNVHLISPLSYPTFVWLMNRSDIIITDSGGVQEEAPSLGKPVLVMRDVTERPEAVEVGTVILVGTNPDKIIKETEKLINDKGAYQAMSAKHNPYGDGKACARMIEFLMSKSQKENIYV